MFKIAVQTCVTNLQTYEMTSKMTWRPSLPYSQRFLLSCNKIFYCCRHQLIYIVQTQNMNEISLEMWSLTQCHRKNYYTFLKSVGCSGYEMSLDWIKHYLKTSKPTYSSSLLKLSPIIVDRKCPTCISLAIFGDEKSITTLFVLPTAGGWTPSFKIFSMTQLTKDILTWILMNPGPATSS